MAAAEYEPLLELGPFKGVNYTKSGPTVDPGFAVQAVGANTAIIEGALTTEAGRVLLYDFSAVLSSVAVVFGFMLGVYGVNSIPAYLVGGLNSAGAWTCYIYTPVTTSAAPQLSQVANSVPFDQAVQFAGVVYTNGGQRLFATTQTSPINLTTSTVAVNHGTVTVTPVSMAGISLGQVLLVDTGVNAETIVVFAVTGTTFTAVFSKNHAVGFNIAQPVIYAYMFAWQYPPPVAYGNINVSGVQAYSTGPVNSNGGSGIQTTGTPVTITPTNMTNIANGNNVVIDSGAQQEILTVSGVTGTTFQVTNQIVHDAGFSIYGGLSNETVYYLFTRQTVMPDGTISESSVDLNQFVTPPSVSSGVVGFGVNISPFSGPAYTWTGVHTLDGLPYTTNIYRQSNLQPTYCFVGNSAVLGLGVSGNFFDISPDAAITGNAQLQPQRDQPPTVMGSYGVPAGAANFASICIHKNRIWVYANVQDTSTNNFPDNQLWYSNLGRPWEFNQIQQVLEMQAGEINQYTVPPNYNTTYDDFYGDDPIALAEVGTLLMALARQETWAVYGDSASSFIQRDLFNIGCVSRHSVAPVNGGMFWLTENGVYWFDGSAPQYVSEALRGLFNATPTSPALTPAQMQASVGSFANMTYYLSFPLLNETYGYFIPGSIWLGQLEFAPPSAGALDFTAARPANYVANGAGQGFNEIVAARQPAGGILAAVDYWFVDANYDLGNPQTFSWMAPFSRSNKPRNEKQYTVITLDLPPLQYGKATVTLQIDNKAPIVWTITDLSVDTHFIKTIGTPGQGTIPRGYMAQLSVSVTGAAGKPAPQIWAVTVWGIMPLDRTLTPRV